MSPSIYDRALDLVACGECPDIESAVELITNRLLLDTEPLRVFGTTIPMHRHLFVIHRHLQGGEHRRGATRWHVHLWWRHAHPEDLPRTFRDKLGITDGLKP